MIELLVVLAVVALLLTLAVPRYFASLDNGKATVLAENLRLTRATIEQFYGDTGRYPESLDELVQKRYLRALPYDPVLQRADAWLILPPPEGSPGNVYDLKSAAPGKTRNGTPYGEL